MHARLVAVLTMLLSAPLAAQWLTHRTPNIPRTATGQPQAPHSSLPGIIRIRRSESCAFGNHLCQERSSFDTLRP